MLFLLGHSQKVCKNISIYYSLMTIYALQYCGTYTDCVYATDHFVKNEKLDTLASHNWAEDPFLHEFLGAAFSLIVIMLQTSFLFWEFFFWSHLLFGQRVFNVRM